MVLPITAYRARLTATAALLVGAVVVACSGDTAPTSPGYEILQTVDQAAHIMTEVGWIWYSYGSGIWQNTSNSQKGGEACGG